MAKKLEIGIDASRSNVAQKTGTEYYSYEIIKELIKEKSSNFILYSKTQLDYLGQSENATNKVMKFPKLWSQIRLSYEMIVRPPDVLFEPAHTIPIFHPKKTVATLHDVGFKYFPELYTPLERFYHNFSMGFCVKHATKIIAISQATKADLINLYNADEKKITVIYHGYDKEKYFPLNEEEQIPPTILNLKPYIYFIGRLEAKKNIVNLIKSYGILREDKSIKHKLVLAGRPGYQYELIKEEINRLPKEIQKDVIEPGYILDEEVSSYMRNASIFAFPSRFEGFGMPLVEAMASAIPIAASNSSSIPEIVKDAAFLSSVDDYSEFASGLRKIIKESSYSKELISKGLKRSKDFDWVKASKETFDVIKSA